MAKESVGNLYYQVHLDTQKLIEQGRRVEERLQRLAEKGTGLQLSMTKVASAISAALGSIAVKNTLDKLLAVQRQFDVMFASLKTVTGGLDRASAAFERLRQFAATTPYTLDQSVTGFTRLMALGLDPSERAMTSFGNTASAMGKDLMQMIEAVADASTGEFERLKEFGIKAKTEGDAITFTFRGVQTSVENSAEAITEYLTKIGEVEFAGAMSERMKTLDGDLSNLEDSWNALFLTVSQSGVGDAMASAVQMVTRAIQEATQSVREGGLTDYFANLRSLLPAIETAAVTLSAALAGRLVAALAASAAKAYATATAIGAATIAARGFTAVMATLGGPIGIAVTALALLAANWYSVASQAKSAAEISEDSARRIAQALNKSPTRATQDLQQQLLETEKQLKRVDEQIKAGNVRSIYGDRPRVASDKTLAELAERRDAILKARDDIQRAMDSLHGGAGRGKVNRAFTPGPEKLEPWSPAPAAGGGEDKKKVAKAKPTDFLGDAMGDWDKRFQDWREANEEALDRADAEAVAAAAEGIRQRTEELNQALIDRQTELEQEAQRRDQARAFALGIINADDEVAQLEARLQEQSLLLANYALQDQENAELYAQARVDLEADTAKRIQEVRDRLALDEARKKSQELLAAGQFFGAMVDLTRAFGGQQSKEYAALFAASKAFAIAESIVKIQQGIAQASSLPFPANLGAMATVAAATAGIVSTIKGANYGGGRQYGGPVSAGSLYRVNETGRPEMFTAANGSQFMLPTSGGRVTAADKVGGAAVEWKVIVNNNAPGAAASASVDQSARVVSIAVEAVAGGIRDRSGPVWNALRGSTNVQGRL